MCIIDFAIAARGSALEMQVENFDFFFANAKVEVERASLILFRPATQHGNLIQCMCITNFAIAAPGSALETQVENFEIFATFFATAKVGVERASLTLFRPAMQLGHLNEDVHMLSFAFAAKGNALETQVENFEILATFFAAVKVDVELASFALFRPAMQLGHLYEGVRMLSFAFAAKGKALETQVANFEVFATFFAAAKLDVELASFDSF